MMKVSIVIPIHNESGNIEQLVKELDAVLNPTVHVASNLEEHQFIALPTLDDVETVTLSTIDILPANHSAGIPKTEVVFVNDVSTDNSGDILDHMADLHDFIRVIHLKERGRQTGCYQVAFQEAQGEYIIRMDGDLQDNPQDLRHFFELLTHKPDIIMGLRAMRRHRRILRIATMLYDAMMVALFDTPFYTNSSSFIAYRAKYVKNITFKRNDHRYLPIIAIHRGASNLHEVVVANRDRRYGKTKYGYYSKFIKGIPEVLRFLFRLKRGYYNSNLPDKD